MNIKSNKIELTMDAVIQCIQILQLAGVLLYLFLNDFMEKYFTSKAYFVYFHFNVSLQKAIYKPVLYTVVENE